jgi:transcriptional regulator with XRE-family HTH domain
MRKTKDPDADPDYGPEDSPIPARIRNRRMRLGLTGAELAKLIGVSPSYISLIESGAKVPSPSVAAKIARALRDSPELYQAWVFSARQGGWRNALRSSRYWRAYSSDPSSLERVASGEDVPDVASLEAHDEAGFKDHLAEAESYRLADEEVSAELVDFESGPPLESTSGSPRRSIAGAIGGLLSRKRKTEESPRGFTLLEIPLLEDGADPGDGDEVDESGVVDTLFLDSRLFGTTDLVRPFAYRPGKRAARRLGERLHPGDYVVLDSGMPQLRPDTIVAVRFRGEVVLARALLKKNALLLLPAPGEGDFDVIDLDGPESLSAILVGWVVLTVRGPGA